MRRTTDNPHLSGVLIIYRIVGKRVSILMAALAWLTAISAVAACAALTSPPIITRTASRMAVARAPNVLSRRASRVLMAAAPPPPEEEPEAFGSREDEEFEVESSLQLDMSQLADRISSVKDKDTLEARLEELDQALSLIHI